MVPTASGATDDEPAEDLIGFKVEATDGGIGKIDKHSDDVGAALVATTNGEPLPEQMQQELRRALRRLHTADRW
ncbi:hypothetical protein [Streptomyces sp. R41]|uniref:Uncharacterized protein n=1 Tax=Streptomyces sp. R41 TaxID=3238632 RepID=A0AB39RVX4_9ACTN